jgi:hypothetical protein
MKYICSFFFSDFNLAGSAKKVHIKRIEVKVNWEPCCMHNIISAVQEAIKCKKVLPPE